MSSTLQAIFHLVAGSAIQQSPTVPDSPITTMDNFTAATASASPLFNPSSTEPIPIHSEASASACLTTPSVPQSLNDYALSYSPSYELCGDGSIIQQTCLPSNDDFLISEMLDDQALWMTPHAHASFPSLSGTLPFPLLTEEQQQQQLQQQPGAPTLALNSSSFDEGYFMSPSRQSSYSIAFAGSSVESAGSYVIPSVASPITNPMLTISPVQSCSSSILGQMINGLTMESPTPQQQPLAPSFGSPPIDTATFMAIQELSQLGDGHDMFLQPWLEQQVMVQQEEQVNQQPEQQLEQQLEQQPKTVVKKASSAKSREAASGATTKKPSAVRRTRHACPFCAHSSNRANNMKEHIMTHYPDRPKAFKCSLCDKPFARKHDMKRHLKTHERRRKPRYPGTVIFC